MKIACSAFAAMMHRFSSFCSPVHALLGLWLALFAWPAAAVVDDQEAALKRLYLAYQTGQTDLDKIQADAIPALCVSQLGEVVSCLEEVSRDAGRGLLWIHHYQELLPGATQDLYRQLKAKSDQYQHLPGPEVRYWCWEWMESMTSFFTGKIGKGGVINDRKRRIYAEVIEAHGFLYRADRLQKAFTQEAIESALGERGADLQACLDQLEEEAPGEKADKLKQHLHGMKSYHQLLPSLSLWKWLSRGWGESTKKEKGKGLISWTLLLLVALYASHKVWKLWKEDALRRKKQAQEEEEEDEEDLDEEDVLVDSQEF